MVNGKTYTQVIQKVVDAFTYYQSGPATGNRYGGWRYFAGENDSDMSTTQWPVIGYLFAGQVPGVTIPNGTVKTALQAWMNAVQYPVPYPPNPYFAGAVDYQPGIVLSMRPMRAAFSWPISLPAAGAIWPTPCHG